MVKVAKINGKYVVTIKGKKFSTGKTIAFLYDYTKGQKRRIKGTFHNFGKTKEVERMYRLHKELVDAAPKTFKGTEVCMLSLSNIDPLWIEKMINNTGFVGNWHEAFVLGKPEAISQMCKIKKLVES